MSDNNYPLLMTEQNWANTQLSIARYFGGIKAFGREYIIVDRLGRDQKTIPAGEPADLVLKSLQRAYRKLGRDRIIELIEQGKTEKELLQLIKKTKKL